MTMQQEQKDQVKKDYVYFADPRLGVGKGNDSNFGYPHWSNLAGNDSDYEEDLYDEVYSKPIPESIEDFIMRIYESTKDLDNPNIDWLRSYDGHIAISYDRALTEAEKAAKAKKAEAAAKRKENAAAKKIALEEKKKAKEIQLLKELLDKHGADAINTINTAS